MNTILAFPKTQIFKLFVILSVMLSSCNSSQTNELTEVNTKMMKLHDEVMPKTMKIGDLKDKVLKSVINADSTKKNEAARIANSLQLAEDGMYQWMEKYGDALNNVKDEKEKLRIYKELYPQIEQTKKETIVSIQAAEVFLKK